ncbi:MAG TPA: FliM/FliN family flagellar motor switch protein [Terracidiphilus sp.]|jgi:flagellar motor switch protein FliN/FliY
MTSFLDCWSEIASTLFAQALAGEPELVESYPRPIDSGSFCFKATLNGDLNVRLSMTIEGAVLDSPLLGEGRDQKEAWGELLRETCDAAAGELLARTGQNCRVVSFEPCEGDSQVSRAFQLRSGDRAWTILVRDEVGAPAKKVDPEPGQTGSRTNESVSSPAALSPGMELLMDVELEAALRFGCREMPLGEILELGPGDVVELDRQVSDPVDLIVGDKIVARGDVVLVNGNFGLRVTEVAAPRKRLESIRCLF